MLDGQALTLSFAVFASENSNALVGAKFGPNASGAFVSSPFARQGIDDAKAPSTVVSDALFADRRSLARAVIKNFHAEAVAEQPHLKNNSARSVDERVVDEFGDDHVGVRERMVADKIAEMLF